MWPNLRRDVKSKVGQQLPMFLNIAQGLESAIHGKKLNLEMPLHSYLVCVCVCVRVSLNGILLLKKREKKAVEEKRHCPP